MGYEEETSSFGIGFPFDREGKHSVRAEGEGDQRGGTLGKEMPMTHCSNK